MKQILKNVSKLIVVFTIVLFIIYLSERFHSKIEEYGFIDSAHLIQILLSVYLVFGILKIAFESFEKVLEKWANRLWHKTKKNTRECVLNYLDNEKEIPMSVMGQLLGYYVNDETIVDNLLDRIKKAYDKEDNKVVISYLLLENCSNKNVVKML